MTVKYELIEATMSWDEEHEAMCPDPLNPTAINLYVRESIRDENGDEIEVNIPIDLDFPIGMKDTANAVGVALYERIQMANELGVPLA